MTYSRVLLKLSGEALMGTQGYGIDPAIVNSIASDVAKVVAGGTELAIVVGGGNIFRGLKGSAAGMERATADYVGMLATVMNAITLQDGLERAGVPTRVQTAIAMQEVAEPYIRRKAMRHLEKGRVVVFGAGCGNPFFTTDTTAALRAAEINADVVFKATKVDGVYDKDPAKHADAVKHAHLTYQNVLSGELDEFIDAELKRRGIKGRLSKMKKHELEEDAEAAAANTRVLGDEDLPPRRPRSEPVSESVLETGTCTVFVPPHCASESRSRNSPEDEAEDQSAQSSQPPPLSRMRVKDADPANRMMGVMTKLT